MSCIRDIADYYQEKLHLKDNNSSAPSNDNRRLSTAVSVLAGSTKVASDRLQCVLNAAARVISGTHKFDRGLTHLLHSELHWLDVPQRIQFKLGVTVHRCLDGNAPQYLIDCCKSTTDAASRQRLRSASRHQLIVPRHRRTQFSRRAFSVAGRQPGTRCQTP